MSRDYPRLMWRFRQSGASRNHSGRDLPHYYRLSAAAIRSIPDTKTDDRRGLDESREIELRRLHGIAALVTGLGGCGGRTRARTWDPLIKSQLLYQLSYAP